MTLALRESPAPAKALRAELDKIGAAAGELQRHNERPWSSITFSGSRHALRYRFEGPEAAGKGLALSQLLPNHQFEIRGHLVADAGVASMEEQWCGLDVTLTLELELLLLEAA